MALIDNINRVNPDHIALGLGGNHFFLPDILLILQALKPPFLYSVCFQVEAYSLPISRDTHIPFVSVN